MNTRTDQPQSLCGQPCSLPFSKESEGSHSRFIELPTPAPPDQCPVGSRSCVPPHPTPAPPAPLGPAHLYVSPNALCAYLYTPPPQVTSLLPAPLKCPYPPPQGDTGHRANQAGLSQPGQGCHTGPFSGLLWPWQVRAWSRFGEILKEDRCFLLPRAGANRGKAPVTWRTHPSTWHVVTLQATVEGPLPTGARL